MACKKCENSGVDNCSGCNHFDDLFGYDIDVTKKAGSGSESSGGGSTADKIKKAGSGLKDVDFKKAGDKVGDLIRGMKAKVPSGQESQTSATEETPRQKKSKFNYGWIIGIVLAIIVLAIAFKVLKKKK